MNKAVLAIHGGAGAIARDDASPQLRQAYEQALADVLESAGRLLADGATALDVVVEAVRLLEECPLFNAGHGAVFTGDARHELDASVMDGATRRAGAVAGIMHLRNPVLAARAVMQHSPHVLLIGEGAERFGREQGLQVVENSFFSTAERREQLDRVRATGRDTMVLDHDAPLRQPLEESSKFGTVGAVACDVQGRLAAATSTGGMTNKWPGRVGDSPLVGAGCYADGVCAVSATGTGEAFMRAAAAYDVSAQMRYAGATLEEAAGRLVYETLPALDGAGGIIAVDAHGNVQMPFNTQGMYRGSLRVGEAPVVAIYR